MLSQHCRKGTGRRGPLTGQMLDSLQITRGHVSLRRLQEHRAHLCPPTISHGVMLLFTCFKSAATNLCCSDPAAGLCQSGVRQCDVFLGSRKYDKQPCSLWQRKTCWDVVILGLAVLPHLEQSRARWSIAGSGLAQSRRSTTICPSREGACQLSFRKAPRTHHLLRLQFCFYKPANAFIRSPQ